MSSTFANVSAIEGKRLLAFMHERTPRSEGGLDGFAERHGLRRQTPYEWASGKRKPNLETLRPWAAALGVTRAEMVAAMDSVAVPEQQETPPPEWAEALTERVLGEIRENRAVVGEAMTAVGRLNALVDQVAERLAASPPLPADTHPPSASQPVPDTPPRSAR